MFSKLDKGLYEGVEPAKPGKWTCNYCGEAMPEIQMARHMIKMHNGAPKPKISNKDLGLPDKIPLDFQKLKEMGIKDSDLENILKADEKALKDPKIKNMMDDIGLSNDEDD